MNPPVKWSFYAKRVYWPICSVSDKMEIYIFKNSSKESFITFVPENCYKMGTADPPVAQRDAIEIPLYLLAPEYFKCVQLRL